MPKPISLLFILVLCIAGYYLLNKLHRFHYSLKRSNGYHTFLSSATAGLTLCGFAIVIYAISDLILKACGWHLSLGEVVLNNILKYKASQNSIILFDVLAITITLSLLIPVAYYKCSLEHQLNCFLKEFAQDGESPEFTQLFFRSFQFGLPILFTMSDRKIYIGYVTEIRSQPFNDVHVIPIVSGHRDSSNLRLVPVTPYQDIIHDVENDATQELDFEAFTVTLPIREIVYAHLHDFEKYEEFKKAEKKLDFSQQENYVFTNKL